MSKDTATSQVNIMLTEEELATKCTVYSPPALTQEFSPSIPLVNCKEDHNRSDQPSDHETIIQVLNITIINNKMNDNN